MGYYTKQELIDMGVGYVGENVKISRKAILHGIENMKFDDNSRVDDLCILSGKVEIGKNVHIAVMCHIDGSREGVYIEDFAGLAYCCNVFAASDDYSGEFMTNPTIPSGYKNIKYGKVTIKKHSIVGASSVIFPGVIIEEGNAIGAMSLVNKSTEPWGIYAGSPIKYIKNREKDLLLFEEKYLLKR